jgi:anti-anti-sigma regulatory factor
MTTNNLIGYDPLAWMDGETIDDVPVAPVKKTRAKAKPKVAPVVEKIKTEAENVIAETPEELPVAEIVEEDENIEIDVSIDENGEIEITIEANDNTEIQIDVEAEPESEDAVLDAIDEEVSEHTEEQSPIESEVMPEETVIEEEIIDAFVEPLVELGSEASLKTIAELRETFKQVLAAHDAIEINASDVAMIDTATLQMLVSLKKDAPTLGKTINIIYPSARFVESAKLLDLLTVLEITE